MQVSNFILNLDDEILFIIEELGDKGYITGKLYCLDGDTIIKIFDTEFFNEEDSYMVIYQDDYRVDLVDLRSNKTYTIDISKRDRKYLDAFYNNNGKLKRKVIGRVLPISNIASVDLEGSGINDLIIIQRVIGSNENDVLGRLNFILTFRGAGFEISDSFVSIVGNKNHGILNRSETANCNKDYLDFSKVEFMEQLLWQNVMNNWH